MAMKMKGLLQSEYDVQSYTDYIAGKRKYFTVEGMTIEKNPSAPTLHEDPVPFLRAKYTSPTFIVSTKVAKDYIKTYEMEGGVIIKEDKSKVTQNLYNNKSHYFDAVERVGILAYIKNEYLFIAYIWTLPDFEKIEDDPEKIFTESFKVAGMWDYDTCLIVDMYNRGCSATPFTNTVEYKLHVASEYHSNEIKKIKGSIIKLDCEIEQVITASLKLTECFAQVNTMKNEIKNMDEAISCIHTENEVLTDINVSIKTKLTDITTKQTFNDVEIKKLHEQVDSITLQHEYTKQIVKNIEKMFTETCGELIECIDKNEKTNTDCFAQLFKSIEKQERDMKYEIAVLSRRQKINVITTLFVITLFIVVKYFVYRQNQPKESKELVCL